MENTHSNHTEHNATCFKVITIKLYDFFDFKCLIYDNTINLNNFKTLK